MNFVGFQVRRVARFFGFRRERHRQTAVSRESQFLNEAVDLLGRIAWKDAGSIDDVAVEFWQIRDFEKQQDQMREEVEVLKQQNLRLEEERTEIEDRFTAEIEELKSGKLDSMAKATHLMREIAATKTRIEQTKKRFAGLKLKLKVLSENSSNPAAAGPSEGTGSVAATETGIEAAKSEFLAQQTDLERLQTELKHVEQIVDRQDRELDDKRIALRQATSEIVTRISKQSKRIADVSARIGALQNSRNSLASQIGLYLVQNLDSRDKEIRSVLRRHRALVSKIKYFRRSIGYYQRLARM